MGSTESRFREAVRTGNTDVAYDLYYLRNNVRNRVVPNSSFGAYYDENTLLHYAALHGMKRLYVDFIKMGGRPDQKNKRRHNCLHLICAGGNNSKARQEMLVYSIETGLSGMDVTHILKEKDEDGNTPLHLAATVGLDDCVEILVAAGADLFVTNSAQETAADCATHSKRSDIATKLETKMVFHPEDDPDVEQEPDSATLQEIADAPQAMKDLDIRTMKDELLIETAQLLGVTLFTAEALLRNHGWSKEQLLEAWMDNPADCCEKAGVEMPSLLTVENLYQTSSGVSLARGNGEREEGEEEGEECGICTLPSSRSILVPCEHHFCRDCWQHYLHDRIMAGDHGIVCPEYACFKLVPVEVVEAIVSREMAEKYLHFDIKAFVESNPHFRWCPHPGCGQAVSRTPMNEDNPMASARDEKRRPLTVHCGKDHYFCWKCGGDPHDPCECEQWAEWLEHVEEMKPKVGDMTTSEAHEAASNKWLAKKSKPCPKCKAPIEKTEGCNHMTCRKCRHDFCWVCLDVWRIHNSSTGGYFECNRYDARKKAEEMLSTRKTEVLSGFEEVEKIGRFLHYHDRYKAHKESLALEEPYLTKARHKMVELAASVEILGDRRGSLSKGTLDMSFIEDAVRGLLQARRVLIATYCYGYYIKGNSAKKMFENMQGALEEVTEMLAEVVARPHLRKPRSEIIRLTREAREKRLRLIREVKAGLPPPTPPSLREIRLRRPFGGLMMPRRRRYGNDSSSSSSSSSSPPSTEGHPVDHEEILRLLEGIRLQREKLAEEPPVQSHDLTLVSDDEFERALEVSRREFEEERQLRDDIERAKALSLQRPNEAGVAGATSGSEEDMCTTGGAAAAVLREQPWYKQVPMLTPHKPPARRLSPSLPAPPCPSPSPPPPPRLPPTLSAPGDEGLNWLMVDEWLDRGGSTSDPGGNRLAAGDTKGARRGGERNSVPQKMEWLQTVPERDTGKGGGAGKYDGLNNLDIDQPRWPLGPPAPLDRQLPPQSASNRGGRPFDNELFVPLSPPTSEGGEFGPVFGEEEDLRRAIELSLIEQPSGQDAHTVPPPDSDNMLDISGPQFAPHEPSDSIAAPPPLPLPLTLPPELRHLLQSNERSGEAV